MKLSGRWMPGQTVWCYWMKVWRPGVVERVGKTNLIIHIQDEAWTGMHGGFLTNVPEHRVSGRNPKLHGSDIPLTERAQVTA